MDSLVRPKLVSFDSSVVVSWSRSLASKDACERRLASSLVQALAKAGWIPVLSFHQFEELVRHPARNERIGLLESFPLMAWIAPRSDPDHLGSVVDICAAEVRAHLESSERPIRSLVERVRSSVIRIGSPQRISTFALTNEDLLIEKLGRSLSKGREIESIAHTPDLVSDSARVYDLLSSGKVSLERYRALVVAQTQRLEEELRRSGDRKIGNPADTARRFQETAFPAWEDIPDGGEAAIQFFCDVSDVPREDVIEETTLAEFLDLATRRKRLLVVCPVAGVDLADVWPRLRDTQLPSEVVQSSLLTAQRRANRASGSDLNDRHLAAMAPYVDAAIVDKRTREYFAQGQRKPALREILGSTRIASVSRFDDLRGVLSL